MSARSERDDDHEGDAAARRVDGDRAAGDERDEPEEPSIPDVGRCASATMRPAPVRTSTMPKMTMSVLPLHSDRSAGPPSARRVPAPRGEIVRTAPDTAGAVATYPHESTARAVLRNVLIIVAVAITLYLIYLLRQPIGWIVVATFLAIAMSGPVNFLHRHLGRRGIAIGLVVHRPAARPGRARRDHRAAGRDAARTTSPTTRRATPPTSSDFVQKNKTLRGLEKDYGVVTKLEQEARKLPNRLGGAAGTLRDLGLGLVNSIFAGVTIIVLSVFMVGGGRQWLRKGAALMPPERAALIDRVVDRMAIAVGNYVAGALAQATIAGITTFIVLTILGVPFAAPLSVVVFFFDLIPLVGATIAAIVVGLVTVFVNFPTATIVWAIWAIVYQQIENNVIQPQIQKRALRHPPVRRARVGAVRQRAVRGRRARCSRSRSPRRRRSRCSSAGASRTPGAGRPRCATPPGALPPPAPPAPAEG